MGITSKALRSSIHEQEVICLSAILALWIMCGENVKNPVVFHCGKCGWVFHNLNPQCVHHVFHIHAHCAHRVHKPSNPFLFNML